MRIGHINFTQIDRFFCPCKCFNQRCHLQGLFIEISSIFLLPLSSQFGKLTNLRLKTRKKIQ